jgi:hypothetical protein
MGGGGARCRNEMLVSRRQLNCALNGTLLMSPLHDVIEKCICNFYFSPRVLDKGQRADRSDCCEGMETEHRRLLFDALKLEKLP